MSLSSDHAEQIAELISRRQPLVQRLDKVKYYLITLSTALDHMTQRRSELIKQIHDETVQKRLLSIDLNRLRNSD